jgi:putative hemolysin
MLAVEASFWLAHTPWFILMAGLLVASAFFSGSETALFSLTPGQLHALAGRRGGKSVTRLLTRPRRTLNLLLLGNMIVNVAYSASSAMLVLDLQATGHAAPWQIVTLSASGLLLLILVGEVAPKTVAFVTAERWALVCSATLSMLGRILTAPLWVLETFFVRPGVRLIAPRERDPGAITSRELTALLELATHRGQVPGDAHGLVREILRLSDLTVSDVMIPRVDIFAHDADAPRAALTTMLAKHRLAHVPIYQGDMDHILGVVNARQFLLDPHQTLDAMLHQTPYIPETATVEQALLEFQKTHRKFAIAIDEYGGTAGMVCLDDLLEELFGDIPRDTEELAPPLVRRVDDRTAIIDANLPIHEWVEAFGIDLPDERISTVGGFIVSLLGDLPEPGQVVTYRNLVFTVLAMRRRRIDKLQVTVEEVDL